MPDKNRLAPSGVVRDGPHHRARLHQMPILEPQKRTMRSSRDQKGACCELKTIQVRFQQDPDEPNIDVVVRSREQDEEVEALLRHISGSRPKRLTVTDSDGAQVRLLPGEIVLISMRKQQAWIETEAGRYTVRQTLQTIERALEGCHFLRISRSELINLDKLERIDFTVKRELRLELAGGVETWASRRYIPIIREQLNRKEASLWSGKF